MPVKRIKTGTFAAGETKTLDLSPYNRFGQRGGRVTVAATASAAGTAGGLQMTVLVGSDQLTADADLPVEAVAGQGPNNETPTVSGFGAPADPITVRIKNSGTATTLTGFAQINIENA